MEIKRIELCMNECVCECLKEISHFIFICLFVGLLGCQGPFPIVFLFFVLLSYDSCLFVLLPLQCIRLTAERTRLLS